MQHWQYCLYVLHGEKYLLDQVFDKYKEAMQAQRLTRKAGYICKVVSISVRQVIPKEFEK